MDEDRLERPSNPCPEERYYSFLGFWLDACICDVRLIFNDAIVLTVGSIDFDPRNGASPTEKARSCGVGASSWSRLAYEFKGSIWALT